MAAITKFDPVALRMIQNEIDDAVEVIEKKYGVLMRFAGGKYRDASATLRLELTINNDDVQRNEFAQRCSLYKLKASDFGRTFSHGGYDYRIVALNPKKRAFPIVCERIDGRRVGFRAESIPRA